MKDENHRNGTRVIEATELLATPDLREENGAVGVQERLREYERVVEGLEEMITVVDRDYRYLIANRAFLNQRGQKREEVVGRLISEVLGEDVFERSVKPKLEECFQGRVVRYEMDYGYPEIGERILSISYFPIEGSHGVDRVACVLQDITERKRMEEALRGSEEHLTALMRSVHGIVWEADAETFGFEFVSPRAERLLGYPPRRWTEEPTFWTDHIHPDDRDEVVAHCVQCTLEKRDHQFEYRMLAADGRAVWLRAFVTVVVENDRPVKLRGIMVDITESKQAEEARREAEEKYRDIFENAEEGIFQSTPDGIFISANPALARMHGFDSPEDLIRSRKDISRQIYVDSTGREEFKRQLEEHGVVRGFEHQVFRKDGSKIWILVNARAVRDGDGAISYYEGTAQDISERKRAEVELRVKDNAIESSITPTVLANLDGMITYVNAAFLNLFGYKDADEVRGRLSTEFVPRTKDLGLIMASLGERGSWAGELEAQKQSGSPVYLALVAGLVRDASGNPLCAMATLADITERRRTEAALKESEERYRDLVENSRELICTHDLNGLVLSANPAASAVLGYDHAELVRKNIRDILAPEVRDQFDEYMARLLRDGFTSGTMLVQTKSGEIRVWDYHNSLRTKGVAAPIVRGMARDITERRRAQKALRESEERYRELFDNARDAIYVHDLSGRYTSVNRAAEELSGYRREEIIGRHYSNFVAPSHLKYARESFCQKLDETLETNYEAEIISKNGRRTPVEISSRMIYENGVPVGVQGTARDISERKQTQEALRIYSRALIEAQEKERQSIARELHDEIGQVLTAVRINLEAIRGSWQTDACLPHIEDSIAVVNQALVQVRELSLDLRPSQLDSLGLSAALRWYVDRYAQRTGIAADVRSIPRDQRLRREVETACFRIVQEALTNVARHAKATRVTVHLKKLRGNLMLSVKDNGVGFDHEILKKSSPVRLGLLGMEERAHSVGGSIEISSEALKGTQIRAAFPLEVGSDAQQQKRPVVVRTSGRNLKNVEPTQT